MDGMMAGVTMAMTNSTMNHDHHDMGNSTMHDHGDHGDHDGMDHSMMHMYFYFGVHGVTILFKSWTVHGGGQMAGACIGVFLMAALYEGLKVLREVLLQKSTARARANKSSNDYAAGQLMDSTSIATANGSAIWSWSHVIQSLLHLVQVTISYALMLIFMTYNGYLAISILIGACVGYFAFGWKKAVIIDVNEHCH